jgi:NAD(P)-dependent dehydrogenase (short-subunit alcohol dehydrogenase family)
MFNLKGTTLFITGASRGIGLAIALRAARDGANIVIAAKTAEPHPRLPGTPRVQYFLPMPHFLKSAFAIVCSDGRSAP